MQIAMKDLKDKLGKLASDELILDVRTPEEFREAHLPGARNIPHEQVAQHLAELKKFSRVYVHCRSGGRAGIACQTLMGSGLTNLVHVAGSGMMDWLEAGYPVEKG